MPEVPVSVWEQIPVIIVFSILLGGGAWLLVRSFTNSVSEISRTYTAAIAEINKHYAGIVDTSNKQWQMYFDAKNETSKLVADETISRISELTTSIQNMNSQMTDNHQKMVDAHEEHDMMIRGALDAMMEKREKLAKAKVARK